MNILVINNFLFCQLVNKLSTIMINNFLSRKLIVNKKFYVILHKINNNFKNLLKPNVEY